MTAELLCKERAALAVSLFPTMSFSVFFVRFLGSGLVRGVADAFSSAKFELCWGWSGNRTDSHCRVMDAECQGEVWVENGRHVFPTLINFEWVSQLPRGRAL